MFRVFPCLFFSFVHLYFSSSHTPLHHFGVFVVLCSLGLYICIHLQAEAPHHYPPLFYSLSPFVSKASQALATLFSSPVPHFFHLLFWSWERGGKGSREHGMEKLRNSKRSLFHLDDKRGKLWSRTWKLLSPLYPFTYLWEISSLWICVCVCQCR